MRELRTVTDLPIGVGFGISTPEQARDVASYRRRGGGRQRDLGADRSSTAARPIWSQRVGEFVGALKNAMRRAPHGAGAAASDAMAHGSR